MNVINVSAKLPLPSMHDFMIESQRDTAQRQKDKKDLVKRLIGILNAQHDMTRR